MNKLLSMGEVVKLLQITGSDPNRQVRNILRAIEEKRQIKILIERKKHFYTTLPILKSVMPELFQEDVFVQENIFTLKKKVIELQNSINSLVFQMRKLETNVTEALSSVKETDRIKIPKTVGDKKNV